MTKKRGPLLTVGSVLLCNEAFGFAPKSQVRRSGTDLFVVTIRSGSQAKELERRVRDNYGDLASDTWMEGDIEVEPGSELWLSLVSVKPVATSQEEKSPGCPLGCSENIAISEPNGSVPKSQTCQKIKKELP